MCNASMWHQFIGALTRKKAVMISSHVIEVAGIFAGAAVNYSGNYRFVAVDPRVRELNGSEWPSLRDVRRVVGRVLANGRPAPNPAATS